MNPPIDFDLFKTAFEQLIQEGTFNNGQFEYGRELLNVFDQIAQEEGKDFNKVAYEFFVGDWAKNEDHYLEKLKEEGISKGDIERANKRFSDRE